MTGRRRKPAVARISASDVPFAMRCFAFRRWQPRLPGDAAVAQPLPRGAMRVLCAAVTLIALANGACAGQADSIGAGAQSCSQFAASFRAHPDDTDHSYRNWTSGFLSGLNISYRIGRPQRDLGAMSLPSQMRFMHEYCETHPLEEFQSGVVEMFLLLPQLPERKVRK